MNLSKPTSTKLSLLKAEEIRSFFHELGHAVHCLVSRTKYKVFHGPLTDRDFSEVPNMMLENFFWQFRHIKDISHHYAHISPEYMAFWRKMNPSANSPPLKIPNELVTTIIDSRRSDRVLQHLNQLHLTNFDMKIHSPETHKEIEETNFAELWNRQRKEITMLSGPEDLGQGYEWGHGYTSFRAPMGNYDAGYYVYRL